MVRADNSATFVDSVLADIKQAGDRRYQMANKLDFSGDSMEKWKQMAAYATNLVEANTTDYVLIKAYDVPFAFMEDVDMLVENRQQLAAIYDALAAAGFSFKHVPFNDRLKLSALKNSEIEIDFYPDSKWGQLRYARGGSIISKRRRSKRHGIEAFVPRAEDEIYMIASHAYNHGRINLLEVMATAKIILDELPDLKQVASMARRFHLQSGTLVLLNAANWLLRSHDFTVAKLPDQLYGSAHYSFQRMVDRGFSLDGFPLRFTKASLISCSLEKISAAGLDESAPRLDELANFALHNEMTNLFYERFMPEYVDIRSRLEYMRRT